MRRLITAALPKRVAKMNPDKIGKGPSASFFQVASGSTPSRRGLRPERGWGEVNTWPFCGNASSKDLSLPRCFKTLPSNEFHKRSSTTSSCRHCALDTQR